MQIYRDRRATSFKIKGIYCRRAQIEKKKAQERMIFFLASVHFLFGCVSPVLYAPLFWSVTGSESIWRNQNPENSHSFWKPFSLSNM